MKIALVNDKDNIFGKETFQEAFRREMDTYGEHEIVYLTGGKNFPADIGGELEKLSADLLITTDLQGFEKCTLTDNIAYNLVNCKQIHLLLHKNLVNEHFLEKQLSISMFFYCKGDDYYEYLCGVYPEIPYLKKVPEWDIGGDEAVRADALFAIVKEVTEECGIKLRNCQQLI